MNGTRDKRHVGARITGGAGDFVSLKSGTFVGDAPNVVDGLEGGPRRDDDASSAEAFGCKQSGEQVKDFRRLNHASCTDVAAGLKAAGGARKQGAVPSELLDVAQIRGILPHEAVHGGHEQDGLASGGDHGGDEVICDAVSGLGDDVRRSGHHDEEVVRAVELDVRHGALRTRRPFREGDGMARQRLESDGADEGGGMLRHGDVYVDAGLFQTAHEFAALVGGNPARYGQRDASQCRHENLHKKRRGLHGW